MTGYAFISVFRKALSAYLKAVSYTHLRVNPDAEPTATGGKMHIMVCGGTGCTSSNSMKIIDGLESLIKINKLENDIKVVKTGCFGLCAEGPIVMFYPCLLYTSLVKTP